LGNSPFSGHPYSGVEFLKRHKKPLIVPVFIPHQGCPHHCVFCDQRAVTGTAAVPPSPKDVTGRVQDFLHYRREYHSPVEIAFYGGSFTGLPPDYQEQLLKTARHFILKGPVHAIRLSTRPDMIHEKNIDLLKSYHVTTVELGAQSMDDRVLIASRRGHTASDTVRAVQLLRDYGMKVGLQIMPGLPGDTEQSIRDTGRKIALLRPDIVRIYPTVVLSKSYLARLYQQRRYLPLTLQQGVRLAKELLCLFNHHGISVIRIGLQASDSLEGPDGIIAGPFHPSFGHLVHAAVFFDKAVALVEKMERIPDRITLRVTPDDLPKLRGLHNGNIKELMHRFHFKQLSVVPDTTMTKDTVAYA
jgi:histone acetyltransferase (RNA polymerase elongator complex component)